jgi:hypothetical protein
MNGFGEQLFARAALACDEDTHAGRCDAYDLIVQGAHRIAGADQPSEPLIVAQSRRQTSDSRLSTLKTNLRLLFPCGRVHLRLR